MTELKLSTRREVGEVLAPFEVATLSHGTLTLPGPGLTHLQFRRFAGCPICNLHLRSFSLGYERLQAARVLSVAFFHSPAEVMQPYQGQLPLPCVPDPERTYYRQFGVERSLLAVMHPKAMGAAISGLLRAPSNPLAGGHEQTGLPADFLIGRDRRILAVHYGRHADDHWSLDELLEKAARAALG